MTIVSGSFLYLEDDLELSELVLDDWLEHANKNNTKHYFIFLKGTRAALSELHKKKAIYNGKR